MKRTGPRSSRACFVGLEVLEPRQLLAAPWGLIPKLINQPAAISHYKSITGAGQTVAVLDTGVDYNDPLLGGRWGKTVIGGYDFVDNDSDPMDESGHGTMVASAIAAKAYTYGGYRYRGIAPGAKIVALRIEDSSDYLPDTRIKAALDWVLANRTRYHISVVNMSFGDGDFATKSATSIYSPELAKLAKAGVFIAAASGNEGIGNPPGVNYPGADKNVYAIGSVNAYDVISSFTSRGPDLDLLAPGENIPLSAYNPGTGRDFITLGSGTSFSTAIASGAALLVKQAWAKLSAPGVNKILRLTGIMNLDGDVESPGTGLKFPRLDLYRAISSARHKRTAYAQRIARKRAAARKHAAKLKAFVPAPSPAPAPAPKAAYPFYTGPATIPPLLGAQQPIW